MAWADLATELRDILDGVALSAPLDRVIVAPGPDFSREYNCRIGAVVLGDLIGEPFREADLPGGSCAIVPVPVMSVHFVADCVPRIDDDKRIPDAATITAWSLAFIADCEAIWNAVADAAADGTLGDCDGVTIRPAIFTGPQGGISQMEIPVRLLST